MNKIIELNIYTDGSSFKKPRSGGIGIRFIISRESEEDEMLDIETPGFKGATNNQMELKACINALKEVIDNNSYNLLKKITIYTDSMYVVSNYKKALFEWTKTKWYLSSGRPVLNADLWKEFIKYYKNINKRVDIQWIKGHSKDIYNKAVHKLAKKSAKNPLNKPLSIVNVRRKKSPKSIEINSIERKGQRISIRIITSEYLKIQKIYKYKYEVISKRSKYFQNIDFIFSYKILKAGHCYIISLNKNKKSPMINKIIKEIEK